MILNSRTKHPARRLALGAAVLSISGLIAACGSNGSSGSSTTSTGTATSSRTAFVKCLKQHGVTPPPGLANGGTRTKPSRTPPAGGGFAANPTLKAAFKACGANRNPGNHG